MSIVVYVRGADRRREVEVADFRSLSMSLRFNGVGSWRLELPAGSNAANALGFAAGILVVRDGITLLSGPVTRLERGWGADRDFLTASGPDDTAWLQRRLALPVPGGPPYTAQAYDVRTGAAETTIRQYVDVNAGPAATAARRVLGLTLAADGGRGTTVTGRARFIPLLELAQNLALAGGDIGFKIVQSGTDLQLQFYVPIDRTATVIFSAELGNLGGYDYSADAATGNYFIAAGGGEGTARVFAERGDSASITTYGRIESFHDRRDTTDTAELDQTITKEIETQAEQTGLSLAPVDTEAITYLRDYNLGDRVTVVVDGDPIQEIIRELHYTLTPDTGELVEPIVGSPGSHAVLGLFDRIARVASRVSHLERR